MSDSVRPHGLQPTRLLCPWDFPGKSTGVGCHCLLRTELWGKPKQFYRKAESILLLPKCMNPPFFLVTPTPTLGMILLKNIFLEFFWCSTGKESTCQCRGQGFDPWPEKIPCNTWQLSPWAVSTEPMHPRVHVSQ